MGRPLRVIERISHQYDQFYLEAEAILQKYNPCKIRVVKGVTKCARGTPCCTGCRYLNTNDASAVKGCTVMSLFCKTWLCDRSVHPKAYDALLDVRDRARAAFVALDGYSLPYGRYAKQDFIEYLTQGTRLDLWDEDYRDLMEPEPIV